MQHSILVCTGVKKKDCKRSKKVIGLTGTHPGDKDDNSEFLKFKAKGECVSMWMFWKKKEVQSDTIHNAIEQYVRDIQNIAFADWMHNKYLKNQTLKFDVSDYHGLTCKLMCRHNNNIVLSADATGKTMHDAFHAAIIEIEKTIGQDWRRIKNL